MTLEIVQKYWALIAASIVFWAIVLQLAFRGLRNSRRGRLSRALEHMRDREKALRDASGKADKAAARYAKISTKGDSVPPNKVLAAKDALVAAQETERLLKDQVQVVRNDARKIIVEEYPPARHEAMLRKYFADSR